MRKSLALVPVVVATVLCFAPVLSDRKEFTNWDDQGYVTEQPLVREFSRDTVRTLFDPRTHVMSLADLRRTVEIAPGQGAAWHYLSVLYMRTGEAAAAADAARRATEAGYRVADAGPAPAPSNP